MGLKDATKILAIEAVAIAALATEALASEPLATEAFATEAFATEAFANEGLLVLMELYLGSNLCCNTSVSLLAVGKR